MERAKQFIQYYTIRCSNELIDGVYHEWVSPYTALCACEIAQEELLKKACEWLQENCAIIWESPCNPDKVVEQFKKDLGL